MIFNKFENLKNDLCTVSSSKMYTVLNQDGNYTPCGFHVEGKMSGIFSQPFRVSDGFKLSVNNQQLSANSYTFNNGEGIFTYENLINKINAIEDERMLILSFTGTKKATFEMQADLQGCWTAEEVGFKSGKTLTVEISDNYVIFKHEFEDYYVLVLAINNNEKLNNENNNVAVNINDEMQVVIAVDTTLNGVKKWLDEINPEQLIAKMHKRRENLLSKTKIKTNCPNFDKSFDSLKLNYDMLVQNSDKIGECYTAGCPDFMWLFGCDTTYGIHGTLAVGQIEMTKKSLRLLKDISIKTNGNGRVVHEVSPFGLVYNEGNLQETPHFVTAVYEVFKWTGDVEFLDEMLDFCIEGIKWAESKIKDGSLCPKGAGIVEVHGIDGRVIDIAILMVNAYAQLAKLCDFKGKTEKVTEFTNKKLALEKEILEKFYCKDEEFFADIICTYDEIKQSRDVLVNSIKNTTTMTKVLGEYFDKILAKNYAENELIPVVIKNWVTILPYGEDFVPQEIKAKGIEQMKTPAFYNDCGMKLACKCDDKNDPVHDIYTLNKSMSINTGYLAEVFAKNNEVDRGFDLLLDLVSTMDKAMPGAISEILPDDGCFMQFWSGYGIHHVFIRNILGINPDAPNKKVLITPNLPQKLDFVEVENLQIGDCTFDISFKRENGKVKVSTKQNKADFEVIVNV